MGLNGAVLFFDCLSKKIQVSLTHTSSIGRSENHLFYGYMLARSLRTRLLECERGYLRSIRMGNRGGEIVVHVLLVGL